MEGEIPAVVALYHEGMGGGHIGSEATAKKILLQGLWWPTLFRDVHRIVKTCDVCQRMGRPNKNEMMPLNPVLSETVFEKWGIDFVGPISPAAKSTQARYIIVATDYFSKWVEARAVREANARNTAKFIYEQIITRFGCPL